MRIESGYGHVPALPAELRRTPQPALTFGGGRDKADIKPLPTLDETGREMKEILAKRGRSVYIRNKLPFFKVGPKQQRKFADQLWNDIVGPLTADPAYGKRVIAHWKKQLTAQAGGPQAKLLVGLMDFLSALTDRPDQARELVDNLSGLLYQHQGGWDKAFAMRDLSKQPGYNTLSFKENRPPAGVSADRLKQALPGSLKDGAFRLGAADIARLSESDPDLHAALTEALAARRDQVKLDTLDPAFIQKTADTVWDQVFAPVLAEPEQARKIIAGWKQASADSPVTQGFLDLLGQLSEHPDAVKQFLDQVTQTIYEEGWGKYFALKRLPQRPEFNRIEVNPADPPLRLTEAEVSRIAADFPQTGGVYRVDSGSIERYRQSDPQLFHHLNEELAVHRDRMKLDTVGRETIREFVELLWQQVLLPSIGDPAQGRKLVAQWRKNLDARPLADGESRVVRDAMDGLLELMEKFIHKPEEIKNALDLLLQLLDSGGYDKFFVLRRLSENPEFNRLAIADADQGVALDEADMATVKKALPDRVLNNDDAPILSDAEIGGVKAVDEELAQLLSSQLAIKRGRMIMEALGPVFIKAFQSVSTVPNLFPPETQKAMKQLYENITPIPSDRVMEIIYRNVPERAHDRIHIDSRPLKAGSIAQVHRGEIQVDEGGGKFRDRKVAIKVVKPGVQEKLDEDFAMLQPFIKLLEARVPQVRADEFLDEFKRMFANECNMKRQLGEPADAPMGEADKLVRLKEIYKDHPLIVVPEVYEEFTGKNVLTMEFMEGNSLLSYEGDKKIADKYLEILLDQILLYGACQADPHPGNFLYNEETGKFAYIDAGLVYESPPEERLLFVKTLVALYQRRPDVLSEIMLAPGQKDKPEFQRFKEEIKTLLPEGELDHMASVEFLFRSKIKAEKMGLKTVDINPMLFKSLFTAITTALTLYGLGDEENNPNQSLDAAFSMSGINMPKIMAAKFTRFLMQQGEWKFMMKVGWDEAKDRGLKWIRRDSGKESSFVSMMKEVGRLFTGPDRSQRPKPKPGNEPSPLKPDDWGWLDDAPENPNGKK